ncbi:MAG: division/cell wall cluster transcriptional repressor MraZ [Mangrovibacterium sp.]
MNFSGEKTATFDEKGRVVLPADYKNGMGGSVPGGELAIELDPYEKCINIYPMEEWEKRLDFTRKKLNVNDREQSRILDLFYRRFKILQVPPTNRLNFPSSFLEKVGIVKEVVFTGQGERIRLWDVKAYDDYIESMGDYSLSFAGIFGGSENTENS